MRPSKKSYREGDIVFLDYNPEIVNDECHQYHEIVKVVDRNKDNYDYAINRKRQKAFHENYWYIKHEWIDHRKDVVPESYIEKVKELIGVGN